jgi:hypothetical protein
MHKTSLALAVALALGVISQTPAHAATNPAPAASAASAEELRAMHAQLDALAQRLAHIEESNQRLEQENIQLKADAGKLAAVQAEGEKSRDGQTDALAKTLAKVNASDWASNIKISGDFRYRDEQIQRDTKSDQSRERLRARFGLTAKVADGLAVTLRLASGADDPRSPNQTLGASGTAMARRSIGLDQYFATWKPVDGVTATLGRMPVPWFRPGQSVLVDNDINPEGMAVNYQNGLFFGNAYGIWLSEIATYSVNPVTGLQTSALSKQGSGANYAGAQVGIKYPFDADTNLTVAVMYANCGGCQNHQPFWISQGSAATTSQISASANGNSTDANGNLLYGFQNTELAAEFNTKVIGLPLQVFANYAKNGGAKNSQDQAYTAGVLLGKASAKNTWELGYAFEKLEKDSYFGQFVDSDFGGGNTNTNGSIIRLGYAPAKNWTLNATYFINTLNNAGAANPVTSPQDESYKRLQLDFGLKF